MYRGGSCFLFHPSNQHHHGNNKPDTGLKYHNGVCDGVNLPRKTHSQYSAKINVLSSESTERPKLKLLLRSKPVETLEPLVAYNKTILQSANPVVADI
nr:eukaryotic translation initiation factor-related protein [Tanacetum cinerariifolium]